MIRSYKPHFLVRWLLILAGTISVALGIVGIFVPLLPTTPFLLLAAACYAGSSPALSRWLLTNRWFGSYIRSYREGRGLPVKVKVVSVISLWLTIGYSALFIVPVFIGQVALVAVGAGVTVHILSRPTCRPE
ncbi:YbaN family protein [Methanocella sp. MCL-LM]|uniref:YbaN family protein n=1 Tax=Methanocella sp. MCL-LM TaxID=3412035 RepID=UPI003C723D70